jgi:predicted MFS family arabinose efflux permease
VIVYLIVVPTLLLHLAFAGCRVNLSLFALNLQASPLTVGIILSLLALLPMIFAVRAGRIIDRIGVRKPMLLGTLTVIVGLVIAVAFPRVEALFAVSTIVGAGFMLFHIAVNYAVGVIGRPEDRVKNFTVIALTFSTSGFLGPVISGFAIDWIGYRGTFLLLAGSALAALAVLLAKPHDIPRQQYAEAHNRKKRLADLLRAPTMRRVFIVSGTLSMSWDLFSFVVPIHGSRIGLSASQIGLLLGAFGVAVFAVRLLLPLVAHRLTEWQMLIVATMVTGTGFLLFPLVHTVPVLMVFSFILGAGFGGAQPMLMSLLYTHAPPGRGGEAVAVRTLLINFSQAGMPLLFGALGAALGMTPVFWTMAVALAASGWLARKP